LWGAKNRDLYQQLVNYQPNVGKYKEKLSYYSEKAKEAKEKELIAKREVAPKEKKDKTETLSGKRYFDNKKFFTIVPPKGWQIQKYPDEARGKVAFISNDSQTSLRVLASVVDFNSLDELLSGAESIEQRIGKSTNIKKTKFFGRPAIKRSFEFNGSRLLVYDFLVGYTHHNLQYGAHPSNFEKHLGQAESSMATYEPVQKDASQSDIQEYVLAGKRRIAELSIKMGNHALAREYIAEGLEINPSDKTLLRLQDSIENSAN